LCVALGIDRELNGTDLTRNRSPLRLEPGEPVPDEAVMTGPRVGISAAADRPWRFWIAGDPTVSTFRPHAPRRAQRSGRLKGG
jgi:DNA-3-methyladenine glycosylase